MNTSIITYTPPESNTPINLQADLDTHTVWATQKQIADTLNLSVPTVNEHIANFKKQRGDAAKRSIRKFRILAEDGKRREIEHHDMTVIAYVGFRAQATDRVIQFQDWVGAQLERSITPITSTQALLQAVQLLADLEQRDIQRQRELQELREDHASLVLTVENKVEAINARLDNAEYHTIRAYCELQGIKHSASLHSKWGKQAAALSRELSIPMRKQEVEGQRWDTENLYHESILARVCGKDTPKPGQSELL